MFGKVQQILQTEKTPFTREVHMQYQKFFTLDYKNYREAYKIFACNGILFNHESPRRGETFVTRKITLGLCKIKLGLQKISFGKFKCKKRLGTCKRLC